MFKIAIAANILFFKLKYNDHVSAPETTLTIFRFSTVKPSFVLPHQAYYSMDWD